MTDKQPVSYGYIAEAGLNLDLARNILQELEGDANPEAVVEILSQQQAALEEILHWARQVNRALSTVPTVDVDDHPID